MIMEISSGLPPIGIPDDWVSRLDYKWIMAIGNHKDATITFDEKQWGDFLDDIRKGHEAVMEDLCEDLKAELSAAQKEIKQNLLLTGKWARVTNERDKEIEKLEQELAQARKENEVKQTKIDALMVKGIGDLFNEDDCRESRRAGFLEAVDTLEKWQGTVEFPIRNLRDKLKQMKEGGK